MKRSRLAQRSRLPERRLPGPAAGNRRNETKSAESLPKRAPPISSRQSKKAIRAKRDVDSAITRTLTTATRSAADFNFQLLEMARSNANSAFDFAHRLMGMQSPSKLLEVSFTEARRQFDSFNAQTRQLAALAQEGWADTAGPLTTRAASAFATVTRSEKRD